FAMEKLANLLRYSLRSAGNCETTIEEELEGIRQYLAIEKIRFEEKLVFKTEIEPEAGALLVPGFLLQPLIENAVKHGMRSSAMPLQLIIRAAKEQDRLSIEVSNTGRWTETGTSPGERAGMGLRLVRERLQRAYPERHRFEHVSDDGWVKQRIEITNPMGRGVHASSCFAGG